MKSKLLLALSCLVCASEAFSADRIPVRPYAANTFVALPDDLTHPEGITANKENGDVYVATFNVPNPVFNPNPKNALLRYNKHGKLLARTDFAGSTPLIGIEYSTFDDHIYVATGGDISGVGSKILRIPADFGDSDDAEIVADVPFIGAPGDRTVTNLDTSTDNISFGTYVRVPNDFEFDAAGNVYISDSFQGAIFKISDAANCSPCSMDLVTQDSLLATAGFPSFGANGIALDETQDNLYIANTGDDRILKLDLNGGSGISIFAESINGPDGIKFDDNGYLWITANQADKLIALDSNGKVAAKLGDFLGINDDGSPRGLLFPGSLTIVKNRIYVTNLSIAATQIMGDEHEESVTRYTVSKLRLPQLPLPKLGWK